MTKHISLPQGRPVGDGKQSLADWYMSLSMSMLTALVHSSNRAKDGLKT